MGYGRKMRADRLDELNRQETIKWELETAEWEKKANRCLYCRAKFERRLAEKNCVACGAKLPKYKWPKAPPLRWVEK
jgi:hypothetical protein